MPLIHALARRAFSERGPRPQALHVGENQAVMLLCLQDGQELRAPEGDTGETTFAVLEGEGSVIEGEDHHAVTVGDVVHVAPGITKALVAGAGTMTVLGVRHLAGRPKAVDRKEKTHE